MVLSWVKGSGMLVLGESLEHAEKALALSLAEVVGYGSRCLPHDSLIRGQGNIKAIKLALGRS